MAAKFSLSGLKSLPFHVQRKLLVVKLSILLSTSLPSTGKMKGRYEMCEAVSTATLSFSGKASLPSAPGGCHEER